jgi:hypothetical protein
MGRRDFDGCVANRLGLGQLDAYGETIVIRRIVLLFVLAMCAEAHVGSPDIFLEGAAGPYALFVTIRPPVVIPGVAEIEVRTGATGIDTIHITPLPMNGEASKHPPTADVMKASKEDPQFFTGALWIMASGSWQVRIQVDGSRGGGQLSVPVPAVASMTKPMQRAMGAGLFVMMLVLALGLVSIVGAGAREAQLDPGKVADNRPRRRARVLMLVTAVFVALVLWLGDKWWASAADEYAGYIYKPLAMSTQVEPGDRLKLTLSVTNWALGRKLDDFIPDHGHLMHLYVIAEPDANRVWHLHPEMTASGEFGQSLPAMPAGRYKLYGDLVHRSGFAETVVSELNVAQAIAGNPLTGDDAGAARIMLDDVTPPRDKSLGRHMSSPDGAEIAWERTDGPIRARVAQVFKFKLVDKNGQPVNDAELYMGMLGHAAFVKNDGTVFAHVHPSGTVPMAALMLANPSGGDHEGMHHSEGAIPAEADFPYGFPTAGDYRIIVQMKHAGVIETGVFDAKVEGSFVEKK